MEQNKAKIEMCLCEDGKIKCKIEGNVGDFAEMMVTLIEENDTLMIHFAGLNP